VSDRGQAAPAAPPEARGRGRAGRTVVTALALAGLVVAAVWIAVSVLPRWWSHRVGDQVGGDLSAGVVLGFMYGFLATLLPLLVLGAVLRFRRRSRRAWLAGGAVALLLASPDLITLGIVLGNGNAAHAADRTLDVEAPWFRGGMAIGAAAALALAGLLVQMNVSRRRAHRRAREALAALEAERARQAAGGERAEPRRASDP
jgi:hypothetical protein